MRRWWLAIGILALGWSAFLVYAYPGYMSFDSGWQLREARAGVFTDWHPPAMALLWRLVDTVVAGPLGMLVLQSLAFLAGVYLIVSRYLRPIGAAVCASLVLLFPPIAMTLAVVWKDCQMLGYVTLGVGLLGVRERRFQLAGLAVLVLASAMRHNAFTITAPVIGLLFVASPRLSPVKRYAVAAAAWLAVTVLAFGANAALTDRHMHPWHGSLALFDIVGTIRFADPIDDAELRETLHGTVFDDTPDVQAHAIAAYDPYFGVFRIMDNKFLQQPQTAPEREAVSRAWRQIVFGHPAAYLRHRWHAFRELLQLKHRNEQWVWIGLDPTTGFPNDPGDVQKRLQKFARLVGRSAWMRPYLYLLLLALLSPLVIRARDRLIVALWSSAILSELALYFLSPTPDFRYSIWLVACCPLVVVTLIARRARGT